MYFLKFVKKQMMLYTADDLALNQWILIWDLFNVNPQLQNLYAELGEYII